MGIKEELQFKAKAMHETGMALPFSVYASVREQKIVNVPIMKPLLICILDGSKRLGVQGEVECPTDSFVILSNGPSVNMRNVPGDAEYLALIVEFECGDFACLPPCGGKTEPFIQGAMEAVLQQTLLQFVEWSVFAPQAIWAARRCELLQLIYHMGYKQVGAVMQPPSLSHKLHGMICANFADELTAEVLAARLALSESTLRRKLSAEGTTL